MYSIVEIYIFVLAEIVYARYTILIHKLGNMGIVAGAIECGQLYIYGFLGERADEGRILN
ncbi:Uncharacterised protein [Neisseria gonorrhoeae]|uniref:Uncharacterized protein n=1 Tax=Neisseria gonorrhoeae TaxID=485 RepID=A0A378VT36_NEIGO|nr:hypothetical protein IX30_09900 [Neisseria gonorrhoeae]SUA20167.1 Uncharacterised protein [Neisseria gonorrhoeae]